MVAAFANVIKGQEAPRTHNILVELFDATDIISIKYDTRFRNNPKFGWSVGIGASVRSYKDFFDCSGVSVPVGINTLFGKRASKFELGFLIDTGYYSYQSRHQIGCHQYVYGRKQRDVSLAFGFDIGYRLQRKNGFCFRFGLSPMVGLYHSGIHGEPMSLFPYIGLGYTLTR